MNRRGFLRLGAASMAARATGAVARSPRPLRVLVLGGTGFLGPATVQSLVERGHTVTLFNRGQSRPGLFPTLEKLRGDRSPEKLNLAALTGTRRWDAVIDVWPQEPAMAEAAAKLLGARTDHYLYVSSVAAYDGYPTPGMTEMSPLRRWNAEAHEYGENKAESERRLSALAGEKLTVARPGPIMGERSGAPDLATWLLRARSSGRHIGPGDGGDAVEFVDVKDVGAFLAACVAEKRLGAWNLTGRSMSFRAFLDRCNAVTNSRAEFVWMPQVFLSREGLKSDKELNVYAGNFPFWRPEPELGNIFRISSEKAFAAGWRTRPFGETAIACLGNFDAGRTTPATWKDFLDPEREQQVLAAWDRSRATSESLRDGLRQSGAHA